MTETNNKSVAIINSQAPFSSTAGKDALDIALIFGSYEQNIALFFLGDGVYQLIDRQNPALIHQKDYLKTFSAFEFYDIEQVYVCAQSLEDRGLTEQFHIKNITILEPMQFAQTLADFQVIFRF
ncbi:sulfurtransferase complex subunit TusC [Thalassomonas haliotis]|uniref:Sulfurtransferase complex subunit TusC n=1 Tax=Thalassomonas haliotis TaxID=485448 RepID=A0ABY7V7R2_9GAMM|nr:sulfurtransferase complex subunit TusC [Thalassomonas haliotis]WDE09656.1 sulfurtransferase complex subunit TusC [Thalassomonas haliotis]